MNPVENRLSFRAFFLLEYLRQIRRLPTEACPWPTSSGSYSESSLGSVEGPHADVSRVDLKSLNEPNKNRHLRSKSAFGCIAKQLTFAFEAQAIVP